MRRVVALVRGFVLGEDIGGNTSPLADLLTVLLRPLTDCRALLTSRATAGTSPTGRARRCFTRVFHILSKLIPKLPGVAGTQVDLIGDAIQTKGQGLICRTAVEIIDEKYLYLLCH